MIYNHVELNFCRAFAPAGANNIKSVFDRGAYVVEHTVRPANVRTAFCAVRALLRAVILLPEKAVPFPANKNAARIFIRAAFV